MRASLSSVGVTRYEENERRRRKLKLVALAAVRKVEVPCLGRAALAEPKRPSTVIVGEVNGVGVEKVVTRERGAVVELEKAVSGSEAYLCSQLSLTAPTGVLG